MRSVAYSTKRKIHIMRNMRRNWNNVWTAKMKSPHLWGIRYGIYRVRYISFGKSTHTSKYCAKNVILRARVHLAQDFAQNLCPRTQYVASQPAQASMPRLFSQFVSWELRVECCELRVGSWEHSYLKKKTGASEMLR